MSAGLAYTLKVIRLGRNEPKWTRHLEADSPFLFPEFIPTGIDRSGRFLRRTPAPRFRRRHTIGLNSEGCTESSGQKRL